MVYSAKSNQLEVSNVWKLGSGFVLEAHGMFDEGNQGDLNGKELKVTHPDDAPGYAFRYEKSDGSAIYGGADVEAIYYLGEAMNFRVRDVKNIDGKWGSLVDKETNAFNGMIGMVQRGVRQLLCYSFVFKLLAVFLIRKLTLRLV